MKANELPANITFIDLSVDRLKFIKPVTSLDIFEGSTKNFHEDGLFSVSIFGRIGSDERDVRFSYIPIKVKILHPMMYKALIQLKAAYAAIMSGRGYAKWDDKEKDFVPSDEIHGETGFHFFMQHWKKIEFKQTGSDARDLRIQFVNKFKNRAEYDKIVVMPAGLRDISVDETGRVEQGEVTNDVYRTMMSIANTISPNSEASSILDVSRFSLQNAFNKLYTYLRDLLEGKKGFLQGKWAARRIYNGTRNVITAMDTSIVELGQPNSPKINNTIVGLYQFTKSCLPIARYELSKGWLSEVFGNADGMVNLVDMRTLKRVHVALPADLIDRWTKTDGLNKVINSMSEPLLRMRPLIIQDYYIGLIYLGPEHGGVFRIFGDIDELPENCDRKNVFPLTLYDLVYFAGYRRWNKLAMFVTRYPIGEVEGEGSVYPSYAYVKATMIGEMRTELNDNWEKMGDDYVALECPKRGMHIFVDSLIPHTSRIKGMNADYDGDTCSGNTVYSQNAIREIDDYLSSPRAYLNSEGNLRASPVVDTSAFVLSNLTGD